MLRERGIRNKQGDTRAWMARVGVLVVLGIVLVVPALLDHFPAEERFRMATVRLHAMPDAIEILPSRLADLIARIATPWLGARPWAWGLLAALALALSTRGLVHIARELHPRPLTGSENTGWQSALGPGTLTAVCFFAVIAGRHGANCPRALAEHLILAGAVAAAGVVTRRLVRPSPSLWGATLVAATLASLGILAGADGGFAAHALSTAARDLLIPLPESLALDNGRGLALSVSFLVAIGGLIAGGLFFGSTTLRLMTVVFGLAAWALAAGFPNATLVSGAFFALTLATAATAFRRPGNREIAVCALLVFLAYTTVNAARERSRVQDLNERELAVIQEGLSTLPAEVNEVLLLGVPDRPGYRAALIADASFPFSSTPRRLRVAREDHWEELGEDLLSGADRRLIVEWGPINLLTVSQRPDGWRLTPRLRGTATDEEEAGIRLLSPRANAEMKVAVPQRVEDDLQFVFEVRVGRPPEDRPALIFYGLHETPFSPVSHEFSARRLEEEVLEELEGAPGWRRFRWRTSVRPGHGEDGIAFDNPDLGLAGRPFWWTVGRIDAARIPDEAVTPFPEKVAPMRRLFFSGAENR